MKRAGPRHASTYRAARRNKRVSVAKLLKTDRLQRGETRSQADRRRHKEREQGT